MRLQKDSSAVPFINTFTDVSSSARPCVRGAHGLLATFASVVQGNSSPGELNVKGSGFIFFFFFFDHIRLYVLKKKQKTSNYHEKKPSAVRDGSELTYPQSERLRFHSDK